MTVNTDKKVVLVTRKTRLEELVIRFQTLAQAKFYIEHLGQDFHAYEVEHNTYLDAKQNVLDKLARIGRYQVIDRMYLPNFIFGPDDVVIALGQDGLVANTMKYLNGQALLGVNPDPYQYDGVLLPYDVKDISQQLIIDTMLEKRQFQSVTMAKAALSDGQILYAVNDFFIGPKTHTTARYEIYYGDVNETQWSSGIIIATGLGSTGWIRSIYNGANALLPNQNLEVYRTKSWDSQELMFAVREPFISKASQANIVFGTVTQTMALSLESRMPENGVIFSDGIEADYLEFNVGSKVDITIADRQGRLII
jgi:NAD kinase